MYAVKSFFMQFELSFKGFSIFVAYRINVIWTPLLNRAPTIENSNTTPVKNPDLGQKSVKIGQIFHKFE